MPGQRILIVEDHRSLLMGLQYILRDAGYDVLTAADGVAALEKMREVRPDLIVADVTMPRMDGYTLCDVVRRRAEWADIPFVFLTARGEREDVLRGRSLGADDYIVKPFDIDELILTVRNRLQRVEDLRRSVASSLDELETLFVNAVSNELSAPLGAINSSMQKALHDVSSLSPGQFSELFQRLRDASDHLGRSVADLVMLMRLEAGGLDDDFEASVRRVDDLSSVLDRALRQCQDLAAAHGVALDVRPIDELPSVRMSPGMFTEALVRLVRHAVTRSEGAGESVCVRAPATPARLTVSITDQGAELLPGEFTATLERSYSVSQVAQERYVPGLDLMLAHRLIRLHSGDLTSQSMPGQGVTFIFWLPVSA